MSLLSSLINNNIQNIKKLIDSGLDINALDNSGKTPLHNAALFSNSGIVKLLIEAGANVNARDNIGQTPLHLVLYTEFYDTDVISLLIDAGADVNTRTNDGDTPLHTAAFLGNSVVVKLLIGAGANVNAKDNDGKTPLHIVSSATEDDRELSNGSYTDFFNLLIDAGANVNARDGHGQTPLHSAVYYDQIDFVKLLVDAGADVNAKDNDGKTPLDIALENNKKEVAKFLQKTVPENITKELRNCVHSWEKLGGQIPYHFFYYYMPKRYSDVSEDSQYARNLIYSFKDGIEFDNNFIHQLVYNEVFDWFKDFYDQLTFANIPASTIESNKRRYESFSNELCNSLSCHNGYHHIHIIQETQPKHQSGDGHVKYKLDKLFFSNKNVFIFDDVVTTGMSMLRFSDELKNVGANVICALSIGRTYNQAFYSSRPKHPYTGNIC